MAFAGFVKKGGSCLYATIMSNSVKGDQSPNWTNIQEYCRTYNIPPENLLDILEDQKVLPMIRGKATEFIGAAILKQVLDPRDWSVEKLNLNPQSDTSDEDVSLTYKRSGDRLKIETKSAVRGSFSLGSPKTKTKVPHFKVKCHKSRSNLKKISNDRYEVGDFDLLLCNVSNAIFRSKSLERGLPLLSDEKSLEWLKEYYRATDDDALRVATYADWRFCLPVSIELADGTLPRTPTVLLENDPNWFGLDVLADHLLTLVIGI